MPEIGTFGLMSGDGRRGAGRRPQATAPILDSTHAIGKIGGEVGALAARQTALAQRLAIGERHHEPPRKQRVDKAVALRLPRGDLVVERIDIVGDAFDGKHLRQAGGGPRQAGEAVALADNALLHMLMRPFVHTMSCFVAPRADGVVVED